MNNRIKELAEQAGGISGNTAGHEEPIVFFYEANLEKFAELIVRECIERVREQYIPIRDQTIEGKPSPIHTHLSVRTERESGVIECGVRSVISLEELIQEQTDKWYKENIGVEDV